MKKIIFYLMAMIVMLGLGTTANAYTLEVRGTDSLGRQLIYDPDLDITWYDYSNATNTWQNQVNWASGLSVTFGSTTFDDWRLPTTVDGPYVYGYDGTTTGGYNITTSEMGHLFYTELGNDGIFDTSGNLQAGGLTNTGDFQNLIVSAYWSDTEYTTDTGHAWAVQFLDGAQYRISKGTGYYGLAVRSGDVAAVPEPTTIALLGIGLAGLAGVAARRKLKKRAIDKSR